MKLSAALLIAAVITAVAVWLVMEHAKTRREIEQLEQDLEELREPSGKRWRPEDPSSIGAPGLDYRMWM